MKTSEQTKRDISVGLINTAQAVIVAAATLFCGGTSARAQEPDNRIDWRWGRPGVMVVTNAPTAVTVTNIATEVATEVAGGVANTMFGPRVSALEGALDGGTNNWDTAYGWGNHAGLYRAIGWVPSWAEVTDKPDLSVYQLAAYWPPNATARDFFTFTTNSGAITITGYNIAGGTDVVIPDYIDGWPVTEIGFQAFSPDGVGVAITSISGGGNVTTLGEFAAGYCYSLTSVNMPQVITVGSLAFVSCYSLMSIILPQVTTIASSAFGSCESLTSLYFDGNAPTIGYAIFSELPANQVTNYVTNPQATGWGETLGGIMPVVRLPLYADAIYQAGELVATTGHVAQAIAAIPEPDLSDHPTFSQIAVSNALPYTVWTGTVTPANGTATVSIAHGNMPVLVADAPCVLTLDPTGYGTAGVSRVSLSYYPGTNSFTFATNVISYAETPTVDTNGWNTLLIRRVSNGAWKGVGL